MFFVYFGDQTLVQCNIVKSVLPYSQFPFHVNDGFSSGVEAFSFDVVPIVYFFLAPEDISKHILQHGISENSLSVCL